jgi:hypothetical protein
MIRVSVDFDSTLTMQHVEEFVKSLLHKGIILLQVDLRLVKRSSYLKLITMTYLKLRIN